MGRSGKTDRDKTARDALYRMEPQLRLLRGKVALLTALAETAEPVEPIALAALAQLGREAMDEVEQSWREGLLGKVT